MNEMPDFEQVKAQSIERLSALVGPEVAEHLVDQAHAFVLDILDDMVANASTAQQQAGTAVADELDAILTRHNIDARVDRTPILGDEDR